MVRDKKGSETMLRHAVPDTIDTKIPSENFQCHFRSKGTAEVGNYWYNALVNVTVNKDLMCYDSP